MKKVTLILGICAICMDAYSQPWSLNGNAGTNPNTHFIGTTDARAFRIRTSNITRMTITSAGRVGIGITSPDFKLDVRSGSINTDSLYRISGSPVLSADGSGNTFGGFYSGYFITPSLGGVSNTAFGDHALYLNTWGQDNTAIGVNSLYNLDGAHNNVAIGAGTMYSTTNAVLNTAVGAYAMNQASGSANVAVGFTALYNNTSGDNVALGARALYTNTKGSENVCAGASTMIFNTTASRNVAIGDDALVWQSFSNGNTIYNTDNVAVGYEALYNNQPTNSSTGIANTAIGTFAQFSNTYGFENTSVGHSSMYLNNSGTFVTALGSAALYNTTNAARNNALGKSAGADFDNGSYNTFIGSFSDANAAGYINSSALGDLAMITASNQARIGDVGVNSIGGYAGWTTLPSDSRFKQNIQENVPGMEFIARLRPITYTVDVHGINEFTGVDEKGKESIYDQKSRIVYTGFIAQEVEKAAMELGYDFSGVDKPKNEQDIYGLRYAEFVVPLVKAVQELNEELKKQNEELLKRLEVLENKNGIENSGMKGMLKQNTPNPFNEATIIEYSIPLSSHQAEIKIYSANGKELNTYIISSKGAGQLEISGSTLSPGIYNYTLFVDGKATESRQMVLTN